MHARSPVKHATNFQLATPAGPVQRSSPDKALVLQELSSSLFQVCTRQGSAAVANCPWCPCNWNERLRAVAGSHLVLQERHSEPNRVAQ